VGIEPQASLLRPDALHAAFSVTDSKNAFLSSPRRNWKNRRAGCSRTSGFSFSRFAPAKVGTDHPEPVAAGFVRPQHQGCGLDRLLNDRQLALIYLIQVVDRRSCLHRNPETPVSMSHCPIELAVAENTLFALPPINRIVPTTKTKMTASSHRILSDILALLLRPELAKKSHVRTSVLFIAILRLILHDLSLLTSKPMGRSRRRGRHAPEEAYSET
jgi:hypothetical protein